TDSGEEEAFASPQPETGILDLRKHLTGILPDYMIPSYFITIDRIPLTANGKVDRKALPLPEIKGIDQYVAPENEVEEQLLEIWTRLLELEKDKIGTNANFFKLGGHSLKATALISKIHRILKVKIPLKEIFRAPTIKEMAAYIKAAAAEVHRSVQPAEKRDYYPLSSAQKRLFILRQLDPGNISYNMPYAIPMEREVRQEKLEKILKTLIERHESLRTSFQLVRGTPVQRIHPDVPFALAEYRGTEEQAAGENQFHSKPDFLQPFEFSRPPLLRALLIKNALQKNMLLLDMHHIITDGVSQEVLVREFNALYKGEILSPLKIQYKDYSQWLNSKEQRASIKKRKNYWLAIMQDELPVLNLPTDYSRPQVRDFKGAAVEFILNETETRTLKRFAQENNITIYMSLLALFTLLQSKLSGQEDIVVGCPIASRYHEDLEGIVGMFVNMLPMRNDAAAGNSFGTYLAQLKERTLKAFENQEYPFEDLVEALSARRDTGRNPLFDVVFNLLNQGEYREKETGREIETGPHRQQEGIYRHKKGTAKFDMTLTAVQQGDTTICSFEYAVSLFKPATIERFIRYFKQIFAALSGGIERKLSEISILTEEERTQVLTRFNDTAGDYFADKNICGRFEGQVLKKPHHIALSFNESEITYRELNEQCNRLATQLRAGGVSGEAIVGIMTGPSPWLIVGVLAILKAGGAYLPLNPADPDTRVNYMLEDCAVKTILTYASYMNRFDAAYDLIDLEDEAIYTGTGSGPLDNENTPASLAYIMYTSGSTGKSKGVMVEHRNINRLVTNTDYVPLNDATRILQTGASVFDASTFEIWGSLLNGGRLYPVEKEVVLDATRLRDTLLKNCINTMWLSSPLFNQLMRRDLDIFSGLGYLLVGGDVLSPQNIDTVRNRNKNLKVVNGYGPTENTTFSTSYHITGDITGSIPIGKPIKNSTAFILDPQNQLQPLGIYGELCVGGEGVSRGYLNNPELTVQKFIRNPFLQELEGGSDGGIGRIETLYKTGDLTRWQPDGNIEFSGRMDSQVKIRGF
ncbi:MAG: amino acid adenylation domain-containing protein, partial [bacterium]|nr:amino acid adenylation domain-containing protein [bacterium]